MTPVGFERTISAGERTQTFALERVATGTGSMIIGCYKIVLFIYLEVEFVLLMQAHLAEYMKIPGGFCMFWYTFISSFLYMELKCAALYVKWQSSCFQAICLNKQICNNNLLNPF
jgi:hypothetical protein